MVCMMFLTLSVNASQISHGRVLQTPCPTSSFRRKSSAVTRMLPLVTLPLVTLLSMQPLHKHESGRPENENNLYVIACIKSELKSDEDGDGE